MGHSGTRRSCDPGDDRALAIEVVTDRARARYGPGALRPATPAILAISATSATTNDRPAHAAPVGNRHQARNR
ncbi:hypothetical protein ACIRO3_27085 [Streptomyces sp. NPDC102278]|uniref:hypothetical protein n=1 Tax=Streptomyces sp. NPDC102278 TaxID=3366152 RepID=UPI003829F34D